MFKHLSVTFLIINSNENNPILRNLLTRANAKLHAMNGDGSHFCPYDNNIDAQSEIYSDTPSGQLLPEELRQFLLKKYRKQTAKRENKRRGVNIGKSYTHKPAFVVLRRDFESEDIAESQLLNDGDLSDYNLTPRIQPRQLRVSSSPWLSSDSEYTKNTSPSLFSLAPPKYMNFNGDSSDFLSSPRLTSVQKEKYQILNKRQSPSLQSMSSQYTAANIIAPSSGNESATSTQNVQSNVSLSIVDELNEHKEEKLPENNPMIGSNVSESSVVMGNVLNNCIIFGKKAKQKANSNSILFSEYVKKHDDFIWLRQLNLFSFVDGVILQKLDCDDDDDDMYQDDSLLAVLPKLENWIHEWFRRTQNVIPIVRSLVCARICSSCCDKIAVAFYRQPGYAECGENDQQTQYIIANKIRRRNHENQRISPTKVLLLQSKRADPECIEVNGREI